MAGIVYRGVPEHGLPLISPGDERFPELLENVRRAELRPIADNALRHAAILVNETGRTIVVLSYFWGMPGIGPRPVTHRFLNFGSSHQTDVLAGREQAGRDRFEFVLAGSARLLSLEGSFGNNGDVLGDFSVPTRGVGFGFGHGGGGSRSDRGEPAELVLDLAILDDGKCLGPDTQGLRNKLDDALNRDQEDCAECARMLRSGATRGALFDRLWPTAKNHGSPVHFIAHQTLGVLSTAWPDDQLLAWFESRMSGCRLPLRIPDNTGR